MKYALLSILMFASPLVSSLAQAGDWEISVAAATEEYRADFRSERGLEPADPLGYFLSQEGDETIARTYFTDNGVLRAFDYGCHAHGDHAHCHQEGKADLGAYERSSALYSAAELQKAIPLALEFFAANVAPATAVSSLQLWEAAENIRFVIGYEKDGQAQEFFLGCHYHGSEMDCHRKRDAGPGQPAKN